MRVERWNNIDPFFLILFLFFHLVNRIKIDCKYGFFGEYLFPIYIHLQTQLRLHILQ